MVLRQKLRIRFNDFFLPLHFFRRERSGVAGPQNSLAGHVAEVNDELIEVWNDPP